MSSTMSSPAYLKALYAGNALWHTSALIHFTFRQRHMMRKLSLRSLSPDPSIRSTPSGDPWHADLMSYLGGMNSALALLAYLRFFTLWRNSEKAGWLTSGNPRGGDLPLDVLALGVLALANASQAVLNFTVGRTGGRWIVGKGWDRITVLDAVFMVLDLGALGGRVGVL